MPPDAPRTPAGKRATAHVLPCAAHHGHACARRTNFLSAVAMATVLPFVHAEHAVLAAATWSPALVTTLLASCAVGLGMSHATYLLRSSVSTTTASVVGVVCKLLTVRGLALPPPRQPVDCPTRPSHAPHTSPPATLQQAMGCLVGRLARPQLLAWQPAAWVDHACARV
jgi:hypothetical protein